MRENPFRGPLEGVGLNIETFLVPMTTSEASAIWIQKITYLVEVILADIKEKHEVSGFLDNICEVSYFFFL